jgi:hypothetical protein
MNISKFDPVLAGVLYEESIFMVVGCRSKGGENRGRIIVELNKDL